MGLFCEHLDVFSGTWPTCGMTRAGTAYELPTWAHRMAVIGSSSTPGLPAPRATHGGSSTETARLLPTPRTTDGHGAGTHGQGGPDLRTAVSLLPTPRATDGTKGGPGQRGSSGDLMLPSAVHLLPTPTASPYGSNRSMSDGASRRPSLNGLHREQADNGSPWGKYAPAIARWARTIHRKPPPPTEPGKKGGRRLSPKFVEWMQGLSAGHVTDVPGISRNDQLKALGNGVVPQQVAATTRAFLEDTGWSL